jgi:7-cyano-7-deazaguanine synthase
VFNVKPKSILILSGGLDSTVSSHTAARETSPVLALTFDYGQRAVRREIEAAGKTAAKLKVPHRVIELPWLKELTSTGLVNTDARLPSPREAELDDPVKGRKTAEAVWVPTRNGLFLNVGAVFAEALEAQVLVTGFNAEEGITFPDNSAGFVRSADDFFWFSTLKKIRVESYTLPLSKVEIARLAKEFGLSLKDVWFCYEGGAVSCRSCESCKRAFRAFREAGWEDAA